MYQMRDWNINWVRSEHTLLFSGKSALGPSRHTILSPVFPIRCLYSQVWTPVLTLPHPSLPRPSTSGVTFLTVFSQQNYLLVLCVWVDFDYANHAQSAVIFSLLQFPLYSVCEQVFLTHHFSLSSTRHLTCPLQVKKCFVIFFILRVSFHYFFSKSWFSFIRNYRSGGGDAQAIPFPLVRFRGITDRIITMYNCIFKSIDSDREPSSFVRS